MRLKIPVVVWVAGAFLLLTWGLAVPFVAQKVPLWLTVGGALIVTILTGFVGTSVSDEMKKGLKVFDAWRHNSPYVYSINSRINVPADKKISEIFSEVRNILRTESIVFRETFSNSNNLVLVLDNPPVSIRVRVTPEEIDPDDFEDSPPQNLVEVLPSNAELIRFHDRNSTRVQKIVGTFYDITRLLSVKFSGNTPEIFVTVNRLSQVDAARSVVPPKDVIDQKITPASKVVRTKNALQISTSNKNEVFDQMRQDISYLEPIR